MRPSEHRGDREHLGLCSTTPTAVIFPLNQDNGTLSQFGFSLRTRVYLPATLLVK